MASLCRRLIRRMRLQGVFLAGKRGVLQPLECVDRQPRRVSRTGVQRGRAIAVDGAAEE